MFPTTEHPTFEDLTYDDLTDPDADYYRHVLRKLIDVGMTFALNLGREADAQAADALRGETDSRDRTLPELAIAYDRVARAVRRSVALAHRLGARAPAARIARTAARTTARKRIIRAVEDAIEDATRRAPPGDPAPDDLHAEFAERLDDPALDDDIANRPIPELIAEICRDLGLATPPRPDRTPATATAPNGKRRTPGDIRDLCTRAARRHTPTWPSPAAPPPDH